MTPRFAAALASRLYPHRNALLISALAALAVLSIAFFLVRSRLASNLVTAAFGPFVFVPWILMCLCTWFGPGRNLDRRPASVAANVWRWYGAVALALFFVVACAWPFMVLLR